MAQLCAIYSILLNYVQNSENTAKYDKMALMSSI
jgi:hypothetical protein